MKILQVYRKNNYGNVLVYPACNDSKTFTNLLGTKTFTEFHISQIKRLGYEFKEVLPVFD